MNRDDIKLVLLQQVPALVVSALVLDGGGVLRTCLKGLLVFWVLVVLLGLLGGGKAAWFHRVVRWGFFPVLMLTWLAFPPEPLRVPVPHRGEVGVVDPVKTKTGRAGVPILLRAGSQT